MASLLDANLYTLLIRPSPSDPQTLTQLIEPSRGSEVRYLRYRGRLDTSTPSSSNSGHANGEEDPTIAFGGYDASLVDAYTGVRLASCSSAQPSYKAKKRRLELHNPDMSIPFEFSGSLGFEWQLTYEERQLKWSRPAFGSDYVCVIDRKPDPSVQVCIARPPSKGKDGVIQLLDYNLARFDFQDLKGLELALYMSLLSIIDAAEDKVSYRKDGSPAGPSRAASTAPSNTVTPTRTFNQQDGTTSPETLALQALTFNADPNEVYIPASGPIEPFVARCVDLLGDESMLFVVLRSAVPHAVQRVVEVADAAKRARHRMGLDQEGRGLYQYVIEDEGDDQSGGDGKNKGPRVIKLDDSPSGKQEKKYKPPQKIAIYLSKIDLPDLQPRASASSQSLPSWGTDNRRVNGSPAPIAPPASSSSKQQPARITSQAPGQPARSSASHAPGTSASSSQQRQTQSNAGLGSEGGAQLNSDKSTSRISRLFRSKS